MDDDRSLEGWAKIILKDKYGRKGGDKMARKPKQNPLNATWEELGMRPGIRVPGTASWMDEWRKSPNQPSMIDYARQVEKFVEMMSVMDVNKTIEKYLSGEWDPEDEAWIAAAIRRSPSWEAKYNQMEESFMSKKQADVVKKASKKAEGASLKERIEALEMEMGKVQAALEKGGSRDRKHTKPDEKARRELDKHLAKGTTPDVKGLLKELAAAKEVGDKQTAFKTRAKLRKAGYSLRSNGKK